MPNAPQPESAHVGHSHDEAVSGRQSGLSRCAAAVSHGRLLRDVFRRRQDGRPRAGPGAHQPRQGRERRADGRLSVSSARKLPRQADRRRPAGRDLRAGRRPQAGQGTGPPRSDAHRHRRHASPTTRCSIREPATTWPPSSASGDSAEQLSGLAWVELSTGRFHAACFPAARSSPTNWRASTRPNACWPKTPTPPAGACSIRPSCSRDGPAGPFRIDPAREVLLKHFGTASLEGFGFDDADCAGDPRRRRRARLSHRNAKSVAGAHRSRWSAIRPATRWRSTRRRAAAWKSRGTMRDGRREGSLLAVLDRTVTAMGSRLLADWLANPLDRRRARSTSGSTPWPNWSPTPALADELRETLRGIYDLQRLLARVTTGRASPRDLALRRPHAGRGCRQIKAKITARRSALLGQLEERARSVLPRCAAGSSRRWSTTARWRAARAASSATASAPSWTRCASWPAAASSGSPAIRPRKPSGPASRA